MKGFSLKQSTWERAVYYIMCIFSFGGIYILRIILTEAIRYAFEDKK